MQLSIANEASRLASPLMQVIRVIGLIVISAPP